jgi:long-chain fatty acid transport protein
LGFSYTSRQSFQKAEFRVGSGDIFNFNGAVGQPGVYEMELDFPQMAAFGIAVHPFQGLAMDVDVKWINWSDTHDKVAFTGPSSSFDTNGDGLGDAAGTMLDFSWDDQTVLAVGIQYAPSQDLVFMAGYNYAQAPIDESDVFSNLILPAVVEQHMTFGAHYFLGPHWGLGCAVMFAPEKELTGENDVPAGFQQLTPFEADSGAEISLKETTVDFQLSYRF